MKNLRIQNGRKNLHQNSNIVTKENLKEELKKHGHRFITKQKKTKFWSKSVRIGFCTLK
jgi:thermostable 8-oxoguanine DNA glycosylase